MWTKKNVDVDAATIADAVEGTLQAPSTGISAIETEGVEGPLSVSAARYTFERVLGQGGMGEVRLCHDRLIGRHIAIKAIHHEHDHPATQARFVREARIQGQLEHPSIVPVYDLGRDEAGALFFTMKRVRGITLEAAVHSPDSGLSERKLLHAFVSVCLAIEFAHARGVIHRDLKPGNVMLGEFGEVNVLDWGIAKLVGDAESPDSIHVIEDGVAGHTAVGSFIGTPGYSAPEQVRGEVTAIGPQSDVYALGAILFEILCHEHYHPGADVTSLIASTLTKAPELASARRPEIAPELDAICSKALALDPAERYSSARDLADAVESFLDGDRDATLRKDLAEKHLAQARAATNHELALREAFHALALQPDWVEARGLVATLLLEVPAEVPPEARPELEAIELRNRREGGRVAARRYLTWLLFFPLIVLMHIRSTGLVLFCVISMIASALIAFYISRQKHMAVAPGVLLLVISMVAAGSVSAFMGPFVSVPAIAATNALLFALYTDRKWRPVVVAAGIAAVALPFALEALGLVALSTTVAGDSLLLLPRAIDFPPVWTERFLLLLSLAVVVTPTTTIGRVRDALAASERKTFLQGWHVRRMVE